MSKVLKNKKIDNTQIKQENPNEKQEEFGGVKGPEPTRYKDWQHKGRVSDF